jgi:hypothetical protein
VTPFALAACLLAGIRDAEAAPLFPSAQTFPVDAAPYCVAIGDLNGDGQPDLAVSYAMINIISVLLGNGDGTFQTRVDYGVGHGPVFLAIGT